MEEKLLLDVFLAKLLNIAKECGCSKVREDSPSAWMM